MVLPKNADFAIIESKPRIYSLENKYQESREGVGEGVFAVFRSKRT